MNDSMTTTMHTKIFRLPAKNIFFDESKSSFQDSTAVDCVGIITTNESKNAFLFCFSFPLKIFLCILVSARKFCKLTAVAACVYLKHNSFTNDWELVSALK